MEGNASKPGWSPVIVAVVIVLAGLIANLFFYVQHSAFDTVSDAFERVPADMGFVKWSSTHQMADIEPNTLFAVVNGSIVGQFQFQSDAYNTLLSAGVNDNAHRPWINTDHEEGTYHVNIYPKGDGNMQTKPTLTFCDTDGDGMTDRKIDWLAVRSFDVIGPLEWSALKSPSESPKP